MSGWTPGEGLVADLRHALAHAPRTTAADRFEAWAWRALLDEDGPALLTREAAPAHVTASAIVVSTEASHTCLVLHNKMRRWVQPGGHLESGDLTLAGAAARVALEETGLRGLVLPEPVVLSRHGASRAMASRSLSLVSSRCAPPSHASSRNFWSSRSLHRGSVAATAPGPSRRSVRAL